MLQKILLFASPIVSAATVATIITVRLGRKEDHQTLILRGMMMTMIIQEVLAKVLTGGTLNNSN